MGICKYLFWQAESVPKSCLKPQQDEKPPTSIENEIDELEQIEIIAVANRADKKALKSRPKTASSISTTTPSRSSSRAQTTSIFAKKTGPTKLEIHQDWLDKRNYKSVVSDFCSNLFVEPEPEPEPEPVKPPEEDEKPKFVARGGARRQSMMREQKEQETKLAEEAAKAAAAVKPKPRPKSLIAYSTDFDYGVIFNNEITKPASKPFCFRETFDHVEYRKHGGNPNVSNLTFAKISLK